MRSRCKRSIMTTSTPSSAFHMSVKTSAPSRSGRAGSSVGGRGDAHARTEGVEHVDVGAGDAAVQDVAADRHREPRDAPLDAADREGVEQRLGWMLVRAVAGVDHGAVDLLGQQLHRACRMVAHHDDVGPHGVERHRCVDQRLALLHRGGGDVHVHDVGAEPLRRHLEGALRARRGLEEQVDQRAPAQHVALFARDTVGVGELIGEIEKEIDFSCAEPLDSEEMAVGEVERFDFGDSAGH